MGCLFKHHKAGALVPLPLFTFSKNVIPACLFMILLLPKHKLHLFLNKLQFAWIICLHNPNSIGPKLWSFLGVGAFYFYLKVLFPNLTTPVPGLPNPPGVVILLLSGDESFRDKYLRTLNQITAGWQRAEKE